MNRFAFPFRHVCLLLFFFKTLSGNLTHASDLMDCYRDAVVHDVQLVAAVSAAKGGREAVVQARASLLPVINMQISDQQTARRYQPHLDGIEPDSFQYSASNYSISLSQPIYRPISWQNFKIGELQTFQAEILFEQAKAESIARLDQAYLDVLLAAQVVEYVKKSQFIAFEKFQLTRKALSQGLASNVELRDFEARYSVEKAMEISAQNDFTLKRIVLAKIAGNGCSNIAAFDENAFINLSDINDLNVYFEAAQSNNHQVRANELAFQVAKRSVSIADGGHLPTVDLTATINRLTQTGTLESRLGARNNYHQVSVTVNIPIYSGMAATSKVKQAIAQSEEAQANVGIARNAAIKATGEAYFKYNSGLAQLKAIQSTLETVELSLLASMRGFDLGFRSRLDVLDTEQQLAQTKRDFVKALCETLMSFIELKLQTGSLAADAVELLNQQLDPDKLIMGM